ncbi:transposase [Leuconostoc gelidum subsp. gasicomitatum]|uniref:IS3 family transposase n=1 Tax=Leuconostoc gasicomitatum TaxID=115778 RepID=UPI001CC81CAD|nr:IS3 family transposase [Leuconostoc gasicomitatum]MBZ5985385.1 transposase [Leuconostoc gasicomitatum]
MVLRLLKIPKKYLLRLGSLCRAPRLRLALADLNLHHGTNRVRRLMREAGIYSVMSRRFNKPTTTVDYCQRPNLIRHLPEANA